MHFDGQAAVCHQCNGVPLTPPHNWHTRVPLSDCTYIHHTLCLSLYHYATYCNNVIWDTAIDLSLMAVYTHYIIGSGMQIHKVPIPTIPLLNPLLPNIYLTPLPHASTQGSHPSNIIPALTLYFPIFLTPLPLHFSFITSLDPACNYTTPLINPLLPYI